MEIKVHIMSFDLKNEYDFSCLGCCGFYIVKNIFLSFIVTLFVFHMLCNDIWFSYTFDSRLVITKPGDGIKVQTNTHCHN
jgi:hypothetical protein